MADDNKIAIEITLDDGSVREGFIRMQRHGEEAAHGIESSFKKIVSGVFVGEQLSKAFDSLKEKAQELFSETINQAREAEKNVQGLNTALGLAGRYSAGASEQFQELAEKIQATTTVSDDTVLSLERLAVTYTKTNQQAMKLTETSVNLAAATGKDVNTAMLELSGTLSGQSGRLQKLFPDLQNFTSSQLRAGAAVDYFNSRFAGAAAAQVNTFDGKILQLTNTFNDMLKSIGKFVIQSPAIIAVFEVIRKSMIEFTKTMDSLRGENQDIFKPLILGAVQFGFVINSAIITPLRVMQAAVTTVVSDVAQIIFGLLGDIAGFTSRVILAISPNSQLGFQLQAMKEFAKDMFKDLGKNADESVAFINNAFSGENAAESYMRKIGEAVEKTNGQLRKFGNDVPNVVQSIEPQIQSVAQTFTLMSQGAKEAMLDLNRTGQKVFRELGGTAIKGLAGGVAAGMAAIGTALVKGQNLFAAFAGAMLTALGQAAVQMGATYILMGIARAFSSYGLDPTATGLIATGSAMSVLGGALMAIGGGVSGGAPSTPDTSGGGGGGGGGDFGSASAGGDPSRLRQSTGANIAVHIQGDVLDSKESGLRIVDIINDAFKDQGAKVLSV